MSDIERTNLSAHVSICELRYQALNDRLILIEDRMEKLEHILHEINTNLLLANGNNHKEWTRARDIIITTLFGGLCYMFSRFVF